MCPGRAVRGLLVTAGNTGGAWDAGGGCASPPGAVAPQLPCTFLLDAGLLLHAQTQLETDIICDEQSCPSLPISICLPLTSNSDSDQSEQKNDSDDDCSQRPSPSLYRQEQGDYTFFLKNRKILRKSKNF